MANPFCPRELIRDLSGASLVALPCGRRVAAHVVRVGSTPPGRAPGPTDELSSNLQQTRATRSPLGSLTRGFPPLAGIEKFAEFDAALPADGAASFRLSGGSARRLGWRAAPLAHSR